MSFGAPVIGSKLRRGCCDSIHSPFAIEGLNTVVGQAAYTVTNSAGSNLFAILYGAQVLDNSNYTLSGNTLTCNFPVTDIVEVDILYFSGASPLNGLQFASITGTATYTLPKLVGANIFQVFYGAFALDASQYTLAGGLLTFNFDVADSVQVRVVYELNAAIDYAIDEFNTVAAQATYIRPDLNGKIIDFVMYGAVKLSAADYTLVGSDLTISPTPNEVVAVKVYYH